MPHRMSPENMLKSLAIQALGKWTGPTYLMTMQRLQATVRSAALATVIGATIQRMGQAQADAGLGSRRGDWPRRALPNPKSTAGLRERSDVLG